MPNITRFPHYHQAENVVTNHVMVLFRMLYDESPRLLEVLLQALCANDVSVGPRFSQQVAGTHSMPDGLILQEPLAVFIETKLGAVVNGDQLSRHCHTIVDRLPGRTGNFLISLTAAHAGQPLPREVAAVALKHSITVVSATFGELVMQLAELPIINLSLRETVQEFAEFIFAQRLVPRQEQYMVAVLTGTSWRDNLKYGVYYEPIDRNSKWHRASFLGLSHDKQVSHVGRIITVVAAERDDTGRLVFDKPETGNLDEKQQKAIEEAISSAQTYYPNFEKIKHRYYLVDNFTSLSFRKLAPGGMMGHRYFDIESISGTRLSPQAAGSFAAQVLNGQSFT